MGLRNRKRGFTLVETVVTVGIVAALAAVVYPSVVKQFDSADPARAAEDLGNLKTGIEAFGINVRPQLPHDIEDLVNRVDLTSDSTVLDALYSASEQTAWIGPYLGISIPTTALSGDTVIITGFSGRILNRLAGFDIGGGAGGLTGGDSVAAGNSANSDFIAIRVSGLSGAAFNSINNLIDGPVELSVAQRRTEGRFRCPYSSAPAQTAACPNAYYLAVPTR